MIPRASEEGKERRRKERTEPLRVDTLALNRLVMLTECTRTDASTSAPRLVTKGYLPGIHKRREDSVRSRERDVEAQGGNPAPWTPALVNEDRTLGLAL